MALFRLTHGGQASLLLTTPSAILTESGFHSSYSGLSGAMRHALSNEQKEEANVILAGVNDFVLTEPRNDLAPSKVSQLERLRGLVQSLAKVDSETPPPALFAMVVIGCADGMHLSSYADLKELRGIVEYRNATVNRWFDEHANTPKAAPR